MGRWIIVLAVTVLSSWSLAGRGRAAEFAADMGSFEIGGSARFEQQKGELYENDEGEGNSLIQILPRLGYFAVPGFAFGVTFEYVKEGFNAGSDVTTFGIGPHVGIYLGAGRARVMPFATAGLLYQKVTSHGDITGLGFDLEAGACILLDEHLGLRLAGFYRKDDMDKDVFGDGPERTDSLSGTKLGLSVGLTGFLF